MPRIRLKLTKLPKGETCLIIGLTAFCFLIIYLIFLNNEPDLSLTIHIKNSNPEAGVQRSSNNIIESSQCKIPKLDLNNAQILAAYVKPAPLDCKKYGENWMEIDENERLQATDYAKKKIGLEKIKCTAKYFNRLTDDKLKWEDLGEIPIGYKFDKGEFKQVKCWAGWSSWKHVFMNVIPREDLIKKAQNIQRPPSWSGLSVYWFSFDSLSQMAFRRLLPKTVEYIEKKLEAVTLNGYNIVGDGTPQAFIPILTGKTELELPLTRKRYKDANFVDIYPFIWKNFSDLGYITGYGEDLWLAGTFTYRLKGFKEQPAPHYTRPFYQMTEEIFPTLQCFGSESSFNAWERYCREFVTKYPKEIPKFGVFHHGAFSHDSISDIQNLDEDIKNHFEKLFDGGYLEDTVVFIGADHGHRFSALRETQQGQLEERLPMMSIVLPEKFRKTEKGNIIYKNLKKNANSLTSPFDIYATFLDILNLPNDLTSLQNTKNRGLSLFRPIPETRTCKDADIEPHWCTCLKWQTADYEISKMLANGVVYAINDYTVAERRLCASLKLDMLIRYEMLVPDKKVLKYGGVLDKDGFVPKFNGKAKNSEAAYMLVFTTTPGNAKYEATVQYNSNTKNLTVDMLAISHVNKYGDTPHCIIDKNFFLATYCVCYDKIGPKMS